MAEVHVNQPPPLLPLLFGIVVFIYIIILGLWSLVHVFFLSFFSVLFPRPTARKTQDGIFNPKYCTYMYDKEEVE